MHRIESVFFHKGYKCVVVFTEMGHRCGYVAVTPDHPLFGIDYDQDLNSPELLQELQHSTIGKRSIIDFFCWDGEATRFSLLVNVHGGITYSSLAHPSNYPMPQFDKAWYFGFDCAHYGDGKDLKLAKYYFGKSRTKHLSYYNFDVAPAKSLSYVIDECKSLAEQLDHIKEVLIQTRAQLI